MFCVRCSHFTPGNPCVYWFFSILTVLALKFNSDAKKAERLSAKNDPKADLARFKSEIEAVRRQHAFSDLRYKYPCLRFKYPEAMALLRREGPAKIEAKIREETDPKALEKLKERLESVANHGDRWTCAC